MHLRSALLPLVWLLASLSAHALPPGTVIAGVAGPDDDVTVVRAFLPDGGVVDLAAEAHAMGHVPKGACADGVLALAVVPAEGSPAWIVRSVVRGGQLAERAVVGIGTPLQAPWPTNDGAVFVREDNATAAGSSFDVVDGRVGGGQVLTSVDTLWLAPVQGAPGMRFLEIAPDGEARVLSRRGAALVRDASLSRGVVRAPVAFGGGVVVDREEDGRSALVFTDGRGVTKVLHRGYLGLAPLVVDDVLVSAGGGKDGGLFILAGDAVLTRRLPRSGVARPQAAAHVDGELHVAVWLDRGKALPGELWLSGPGGARRLLEPVAGTVVEVYGVVGDEAAAGGAR